MKSISISGQHFTKRVSKVKLPYLDEVVGYYLFGGNAAASLPNLAYGASQNLSAIGTPAYGAAYAEITSANGFDTSLLLDTPFTHIVVGKMQAANATIAMTGRGTGNGDNFVDMMRCSSNSPYTFDGWPDGSQNQSMNGVDASSGYRQYAQSWGGTGTRHMICHLLGDDLALQVSSVNVTHATTPTHSIKFGNSYNNNTPVFRIAAAVLAAKVLTVQQIYEIGIYLRALLATRGLTVL